MLTRRPASQNRSPINRSKGERFLRSRVKIAGRPELSGSCDDASARRLLCSVFSWCLRDRGERRLIRPGTERTACGSGPTCGTAGRHGASCATPGHGSPCAARSNGAAGRTGVPSGSPATASGHGAASDAALRRAAAPGRTALCRVTTRLPPTRHPSWSGCAAAASGHGAASDAAHRRTIAAERTACLERAAVATGADRTTCATA